MVAFTAGAVLTAANLNTAFNALTFRAVTGTSDTLVLADNGGGVTYSNASATTATVPPFSSVAYANGTVIQLLNLGAGVVTVTAGAGVTINGTPLTLAQNAGGTLIKTATNTWYFLPPGGGGKILQVVSATYSTSTSNNSATYADTGLSLAITPSSATSKVLVLVSQALSVNRTDSNDTAFAGARIVRTATTLVTVQHCCLIRAAVNGQTNLDANGSYSLTYLDSPATTSATTYKTQFNLGGGASATAQLGSTSASVITLMEVAA